MALLGKGVLAIWNGVKPGWDEAFLAWHVGEHIPERVGVPGFLRARRYAAPTATPPYFNFYETETPETLSSAPYTARLMAPTPWTTETVAQFTDTSRTACDVVATHGLGTGAFIATIQFTLADPAPLTAAVTQAAAAMLKTPGLCGLHLLKGREPAANALVTEEMRLRGKPDETVAWLLLIEAATAEGVAGPFSDATLQALGAGAIRRGVYAFQFALDKAELPA